MTLRVFSAEHAADTCPGPCSRSMGYLVSRSHHTSSCQISHTPHTSQHIHQCQGHKAATTLPHKPPVLSSNLLIAGTATLVLLQPIYPQDCKQAVPNTYFLLMRTGSLVRVSPLSSPIPPFFP